MKKSYILGGAIFLLILSIILLLLKTTWSNNPEKASADLGTPAKAESFAPASSPTISAEEKVIGELKAPVKIIVYEDYSNIFSGEAAESIRNLKLDFGNKIVVAVRPYAIKEKPASIEAAMAVECAFNQEKWQEMRDGIFTAVKNNNLSSEEIKNLSANIGLDQATFAKCLTDAEKQGIMLQVSENAKQYSVYGAPTIFVNNELIVGARPYDDYLNESNVKVEGLKTLVGRQIK